VWRRYHLATGAARPDLSFTQNVEGRGWEGDCDQSDFNQIPNFNPSFSQSPNFSQNPIFSQGRLATRGRPTAFRFNRPDRSDLIDVHDRRVRRGSR